MNPDYNMISAIMAVISSLIAIYAIVHEFRRSRFSFGMDLLFKITDQFNHPDFTLKRIAAAKFLLKLKDKTDYYKWICPDLDEILDFFQIVGSLTRRGALDKNIVWEYYSYWVNNYYVASEQYIKLCQQEFPQTYEDIVWLHKLFIKLENKEYKFTKRKYSDPSPAALKQFLIDESNLRINKKDKIFVAGAKLPNTACTPATYAGVKALEHWKLLSRLSVDYIEGILNKEAGPVRAGS